MPTVRLKQLEPGMILSRDVQDLSGRLLLRNGKSITAQHLRIFKIWGVSEVEIKDPQAQPPQDAERHPAEELYPPKVFQAAQSRTNDLFRRNETDHVLIRELRTHCISLLCAEIAAGKDAP